MEKELQNLLKILDDKIDALKLNLDKAQKICDDVIDEAKKFAGGLMPENLETYPDDCLAFDEQQETGEIKDGEI